jgi:hypothetical protein
LFVQYTSWSDIAKTIRLDSHMKLMITVCLLISAAVAQNAASPVQTESYAPSLAVTFTRQQGNSYYFQLANSSSHAVTAFAMRMVPSGVQKVDGRYECAGQCGRLVTLATNGTPAIKAGGLVEWSFAISTANTGAVVAEAAIFNDESYEGEDRAAAFLVASQIGRQAEYDRLVAAVVPIIAGSEDDARKTTQIRMKLASLSVNLDPAMVRTFRLWFPALADCMQPFARFMKKSAAGERRFVAESMDRFAHGMAPGKPSLAQWWQTTQQELATYGCNGCATQAMKPKPPAAAQNASLECPADLPVIYTASFDGEGLDLNADDAADQSELEAEDMEAVEATHVPKARPAPSPLPVRAAAPLAPSEPVTPSTPAPLEAPPKAAAVAPLAITPDGKVWMGWRQTFGGPVPDHLVYRAFFRDIGYMGDPALHEPVLWHEGQTEEYHGPRVGGLSDAEIAVLKEVSAACNQQLSVLFAKSETLLLTSLQGYPMGWLIYAPPLPGLRELRMQETAALNAGIEQLRSRLGAASFARMDGFVRKVYHASPGRMVAVPIPDEALYGHFFLYLVSLDQLALNNLAAKKEAARRQEELRAAGLGKNERALLAKIALDYSQAEARFEAGVPGALQVGTPQPVNPNDRLAEAQYEAGAPGAVSAGSPQPGNPNPIPDAPALLAQLRALRSGRSSNANNVPAGTAMPAQPMPGSISGVGEARLAELQRRQAESRRSLLADIAQLRAGMGEPVFHKFDRYLHKLYAPAAIEKTVAIAEAKAGVQSKAK